MQHLKTYGDYPSLGSVKRILIIKLRQIGDVLLTGAVFTTLRSRFPNAIIDVYVYADAAPILKGHPSIDTVLTIDRGDKKKGFFRRFWEEAKRLKTIRQNKYDLVINLTEGDRGAIVAKVSKAPVRVGVEPKNSRMRKCFTHIVKNCSTLRHTVERNLDALRRIGIFPTDAEKELFLHVEPLKRSVPSPFVLIHPTSRWMFKSWPAAKLRELVEKLLAAGMNLVFTSGPDSAEVAYVNQVTSNLPVTNLAGQISLEELTALIGESSLLLCVDSLPFHMASALKKKVIALFGPTSDITWGPWKNPAAKVITMPMSCRPCYMDGCGGSKVSDCLVQIPVELVYEQILESVVVSAAASPKVLD